jgi:2-phosphosulfolactate phosphatase
LENKRNRNLEVCFSPANFPFYQNKEQSIIVIVDILRATTAICTGFENGVSRIIPVASLEETYKYKNSGYLIAGERDGKVIDGADFGNSPFNFTREAVHNKTIVITTTNGTQAIEMAKDCSEILLGSFLNLSSLSSYLIKQHKDVMVLCAGWKNRFNLEDSIFAGALAEIMQSKAEFSLNCDSAMASLDLWKLAKNNVLEYIEKSSHRHRLKKMGLDDVLEYCFTPDITEAIPVYKDNYFTEIGKLNA